MFFCRPRLRRRAAVFRGRRYRRRPRRGDRARLLRLPADRAREAAPALARPAQADPLLLLHRRRPGALLVVFRCCAGSCCSTTSARISCRAACAPSANRRAFSRAPPRSKCSAPADATSPRSSQRGRRTPPRNIRKSRSRWCRSADVQRARIPNSEFPNSAFERRVRGRMSIRQRRFRRGSIVAGFTGVLAYSHRVTASSPAEDTHLLVRAASRSPMRPRRLRGRRRSAGQRRDPHAAAQGHRRRAEERQRGAAARGSTDAKPIDRPDGGDAGRATPPTPGLLSSLKSFIDYHDWDTGAAGAMTVSRSSLSVARALRSHLGRRGRASAARFGQGAADRAVRVGALFLIIEAMALIAGFALAQVDHRIGARAVHRHRARAAGRLHPQDRGAQRRSARRAGAVVQLDDREYRGSAARRRRRRNASRRSCASRTRSRCRCCRRGR